METSSTLPDENRISTELWIEQGIRLYIYPVVLLTGLTGNTLSIAILTRPAMRSLSAYTYLTVLSFTDNLVLLSHLLRLWIEALTGYDVSRQHNWACKLKSVVGFTTTHYSGWLIVVMTVDRYMAVCRPLQASCYGEKRRRTFSIISFLFLFFLLFNLHFLWTNHLVPFISEEVTKNFSLELHSSLGINEPSLASVFDRNKLPEEKQLDESTRLLSENSSNFVGIQFSNNLTTIPDQSTSRYVCDNFEEYKIFYEYFWPWIDSTLHCWAPFIILSVLNFIIATKVVESKKTRNKLTNNRLTSCTNIEHSKNLEVSNDSFRNQNTSSLRCKNNPDPDSAGGTKFFKKCQMISKLQIKTTPQDQNHLTIANNSNSKTPVVTSVNGLKILKYQKTRTDSQENDLIPSQKKAEHQPNQVRRMKHSPRQASKRTKVDGDLRLAVMLLVVSFTFLMTTLPVNMFMIVKTLLFDDEMYEEIEDRLIMWQTICDLLMYSNHAINFFLYCATGAKFRRQLFLALSKFGR